jgi:hypothetical protein
MLDNLKKLLKYEEEPDKLTQDIANVISKTYGSEVKTKKGKVKWKNKDGRIVPVIIDKNEEDR